MNLFSHAITREVRAYLYHRFFLRASLITSTVFAWIVVLEVSYLSFGDLAAALGSTAFVYAVSHALTFFLLPLTARVMRFGTRRVSILALLAHVNALLVLAYALLTDSSQSVLWSAVVGFAALTALYRALYVIPYHVNTELGFSVGRSLTGEVLLTLVPLAIGAAFAGGALGGGLALLVAAASSCIALLLLLVSPTTYETYDYTYSETVRILFSRTYGEKFAHATCSGMQGAGLLFVWPLAVFLMLNGSYYVFGAILTVTLFCVFFLRLLGGVFRRRQNPRPALYPFVTGSAWMVRFFAFSPLLFVAADVLHYALIRPRGYHIDLMAYEQDADGGSFVDEGSVVREMGLTLGRVLIALIITVSALYVTPVGAVALAIVSAGVASIFSLTQKPFGGVPEGI